jgi:hypothetical protein
MAGCAETFLVSNAMEAGNFAAAKLERRERAQDCDALVDILARRKRPLSCLVLDLDDA